MTEKLHLKIILDKLHLTFDIWYMTYAFDICILHLTLILMILTPSYHMITDRFCGYLSNPSLISRLVSRNMNLRDAKKSFPMPDWIRFQVDLFPRSFYPWPVFFVSHPCKCSSAQLSICSFAPAWKSSHLFEIEVKEKSYISTVFQLIIFIQIMEEFTERFYCKWYIFDIFGILCHDWPRTRIILIFYFWTISGFYLFSKYFTWHEKAFSETKW